MNRALQEKRTLVEMARRFGQEPAPRLLAEIAELEAEEQQRQQREVELRERITADLTEIFGKVTTNELVPTPPDAVAATPATNTITLTESQADQQLEINIETPRLQDAVADYLRRNVRESTVVNPEPVLAQPQKDLEREVRYLKEWVSRIAATGPGSGEVNFRWLDDVDRSSINKDWFLNYEPSTKKFTFVDTRCSIEAFDRSSSIALTATPTLLRPSSVINNKNITYDSSTGVFTFLRECEVSLALTVNAVASAAGQRVYQYAERNTGSGWTVIANSGKNVELVNGVRTQIVNTQSISRLAGEQIRYFIYSDDGKVNLLTETLPGTTGVTVYIPAIRIQFAGR